MARPKSGYALKSGLPVPGATTPIGLLNKPALVGWSGKTCTQAAWTAGKAGAPLPKWTDILYGQRDRAAEAGTFCHELAELYVRGDPLPAVPDTEVGRKGWQAFENFVHWLDASALKILPHERPLVSEEFGFGGTPDATAEMSSKPYLVDYKTGAGGVYYEVVIQAAAYRQLLHEVEGVDVAGAHVIRFARDTGDFHHAYFAPDALDSGWDIFRHLLAIYQPVKDLEKRVK